jgi:hypothetical protein
MDDRVWLVSYYALATVQDMKSSGIKTCYTASEYVFPNPVFRLWDGDISPVPEITDRM